MKQIVSLEIAKLAQSKGYEFSTEEFDNDDEEMALYSGYYRYGIKPNEDKHNLFPIYWVEFNHGGAECTDYIDAPTLEVLQKWLREEHNSILEITMYGEGDGDFKSKSDFLYEYELNYYGKNFEEPQGDEPSAQDAGFYSWEGALEAGIIRALNLLP